MSNKRVLPRILQKFSNNSPSEARQRLLDLEGISFNRPVKYPREGDGIHLGEKDSISG